MNKTHLSTSTPSLNVGKIFIEHGLLINHKKLASMIERYGNKFVILTNHSLVNLYGKPLLQSLQEVGLTTYLFSFPDGEPHKTRATKESLENKLFEEGLGRDTCILALGGGVVTDMAGYLAATYCRGLPLVLIPTSLLAMVDASIGGKNGVNVPYGKNMIGSIYLPKKILIDPEVLHSLPLKELRNGFVEMIKHGLIANSSYFTFLELEAELLLKKEPLLLEKAIFESCQIKNRIVEDDEKENGKRRLLNFGHTIGHALETLSQYSLSHGEAVAIGMLIEGHISMQLGILSPSSFERIQKILVQYDLPLKLPSNYSIEKLLQAMILDKKSLQKTPRFVMIQKIGSCLECEGAYCTSIEENLIKTALQWLQNACSCD